MTIPGIDVAIADEAAPRFAAFDTATLFVVGGTERGPASPRLVRSLGAFVDRFGGRTARSRDLYDYLDVAFREGLGQAYVMPAFGSGAATSDGALEDGGGDDTLTIEAAGSGVWGDDIDVTVAADGSGDDAPFQITVAYDGEDVETSPVFTETQEAELWSLNSDYIRLTAIANQGNPDDQSVSLTGGGDGAAVGDAAVGNALDALPRDLGPGQVAAPGFTSAAVHGDLLEHGLANLRNPLLDLTDVSSAATLTGAVSTARSGNTEEARFAQAYAPWALVPGIAAGTTRKVPYSAVAAGLIARSQALGNPPNVAAAGENGIARYAIGLSQEAFSDDDRDTLNEGGVTVARQIRGQIRTYGIRTIVNPDTDPRWVEFGGSREVVFILARCEELAERFVADQIDGRGRKIAELRGEIQGVCLGEYQRDALHGETPDEAFFVDTSGNTPESIQARRLVATLLLKTSPGAERVEITLSKQLITE